jgi:2-hydroxychromene-2-carboxylate isomerase
MYYDVASPYAYLALTRIEDLAARHQRTLVYKPMLLGKVFEATGNRMPAAVPAKGKYMMSDLERWAAYYGVPFRFPSVFPVNSKTAQRIAAILPAHQVGDWARAAARAYWAENQDIGTPEGLQPAIDALGWQAAPLLEQAESEVAKTRLRELTEEAVDRGVFGAPSFFVGEAMFWGCDRLGLLEHHLSGARAA